jgi:eukaryotic-like serine/threonine-protein kinase
MKIRFGKFNQDNLGGVLINFLLAGGVILLLLILYFFVYLPNTTNHGETITVPDIEGRHISELDEILNSKDLRYEVDDSSYSADYKPLTVLKQYPHAGAKVKEGRKIYIAINSVTPPTVPLPNVIDKTVLNADMILKSNELKRGRISLVPGPFANVIKEMKFKGVLIEPGTRIPKGSVIDLVVEDGGGPEPLENMVGMPYDEVVFNIRGYNLNLGEVYLLSDTTEVGAVVIKHTPAGGEKVKIGDVVDLWIGAPGTPPPGDDDEPE